MSAFFFFQAEDGIRDVAVTGVQTCALPISALLRSLLREFHALALDIQVCGRMTPPRQLQDEFAVSSSIVQAGALCKAQDLKIRTNALIFKVVGSDREDIKFGVLPIPFRYSLTVVFVKPRDLPVFRQFLVTDGPELPNTVCRISGEFDEFALCGLDVFRVALLRTAYKPRGPESRYQKQARGGQGKLQVRNWPSTGRQQ